MLTAAHVAAAIRTSNVLLLSYRFDVLGPLCAESRGSGMGFEEAPEKRIAITRKRRLEP